MTRDEAFGQLRGRSGLSRAGIKRTAWAGVGASLLLTGAARASLIDIDINGTRSGNTTQTFSGPAVLGSSGDIWNGVEGNGTLVSNASGSTSLVTSTGTTTGVTVTQSTGNDYLAVNGSNNLYYGGSAQNYLLGDYTFVSSGSMTFTINGLSPNSTYDLVVYGIGNTSGQGTIFTGAVNLTTSGVHTGSGSTYTAGADYVRNTTATSDGSGTLTIVASPGTGGYAVVNGLQISGTFPTPEPSSLCLIGTGTLLGLRRRRR